MQLQQNPVVWRGLRYPDSDLVGLLYRFARPGRDCPVGARALDVGCGPGRHVQLLSDLGFTALGIDPDPAMVRQAQENGVAAQRAAAAEFRSAAAPAVVVAWGFTMMVPDGPAQVAALRPQLAFVDWRTPANACYAWSENARLPDGGVRLRHAGHTLDGLTYYFYEPAQCELPGYERLHWQIITRETAADRHVWCQTVHRRQD